MWAVCDNSIAHIRYQMGTNPGIGYIPNTRRSGYAQLGEGGGTAVPRKKCPAWGDNNGHSFLGTSVRGGGGGGGGQSCLGMNVRGDTFSRGTAMPPTPALYERVYTLCDKHCVILVWERD